VCRILTGRKPETYGNGGIKKMCGVFVAGRSVAMTEHAVVIAGGGPAGMMLAAELALAKVDVAVVERRPDHVLVGSRAGGFHSRTIEILDQRGVADRFLAEGQVAQAAMLAATVLDMSDFPTRHPYSLGIWQNQIERIMAAWIAELPVRIYYGREVTGFAQDDTGVDVERPTRGRCGRSISSGATEDAASFAKQPASSSPDGIRPGAT
jgi:2-polyprenyl-6-methoxyphenol hydroxylase-like FAD-dependent oxidoreductase